MQSRQVQSAGVAFWVGLPMLFIGNLLYLFGAEGLLANVLILIGGSLIIIATIGVVLRALLARRSKAKDR